MDLLIAVIFILVLGLAVAQFFIMTGAFKRQAKPTGGDASGSGIAPLGGTVSPKTRHEDANSPESADSSSDGGGDGGGGGGE